MLYASDDLAKVKAPRLHYGDRRARKKFRVAYIKYYVIEHENVMRQRPNGQRVLPHAVIECIEPNMLMYIYKYELPRAHRSDNPSLLA